MNQPPPATLHDDRDRIDTEGIVIGYAMSRLDSLYLREFGAKTWLEAYQTASRALGRPVATFKNLRDEFDPFHPNQRAGWHKRDLRSDRLRVLVDLEGESDNALLELVRRILGRDTEATSEAIESLSNTKPVAWNVAERLLTARLAEDYFLANSHLIVGAGADRIIDRRSDACGYDFGVRGAETAIEVKGLKPDRGNILFTDREWSVAGSLRSDYLVVVVGNLSTSPEHRVVSDPVAKLPARCVLRATTVTEWVSPVSLVS